MSGRRENVFFAMPQQYRNINVSKIKIPRATERDNVVYPAIDRFTKRFRMCLRDYLAEGNVTNDLFVGLDELRPQGIQQSL